MFYTLATKEAAVASKVDRAVMLAPCLYNDGMTTPAQYGDYYGPVRAIGMNLMYDENMQANTDKLCDPTMPEWSSACLMMQAFTGGDQQWEQSPVKSMEHAA